MAGAEATAVPAPLSSGDLDRLRDACARRAVDARQSLFGPASVTWRVNREAVLLLGGGRALLLQVAHPLVAAGVAAHSRFRTQPLQRLWRTLDLMQTIVFADAAGAIRAVGEIERVHARVRGTLDHAVGPFPRGTPYDASDPRLLFWVHATLVDTARLVYERFVARLPAGARAAYYEESKIAARLFRIPEDLIPRTAGEFREYVNSMVHGRTLAVGPAGREIAASILRPPLPFGVRHAFQAPNFLTIGLLPAPVRKRYGFPSNRTRRAAIRALAAAIRQALPFLPDAVRLFPHARRAVWTAGPGS